MVPETTPNLVTLACEEIVAGKVIGIPGIHNPFVPLRPEIEEARRLAKELAESQAALDSFPDLIDMRALTAKPAEELDEEDVVSEELAADDIIEEDLSGMSVNEEDSEEIADELILEDIADDTEEDIKDLIELDGAETEDAE